MARHYASARFVEVASLGGIVVGIAAFSYLPSATFVVAGTVIRSLWVVLGVIGAFSIQILMQLLTLGEDRSLSAREQRALSVIVDQRMRYLWDLTGVAVLALIVCLSAGSIDAASQYARILIAFALGLTTWTALLSARLPSLYREIRDFRWRLARERNEAEARRTAIAALNEAEKNPLPEIPEPERRNGTG